MNPAGMGNSMRTNNTLYVELMKYPPFRAKFLSRLGELMGTDFTTQAIVGKVNERINELMPEMDMHMAQWQGIVDG